MSEDGKTGRKVSIGVFGLTSCGGDQMALFNCEDETLTLGRLFGLAAFDLFDVERKPLELDVALVEGAVAHEEDRDRLVSIRKAAKTLIALGTCATFGGLMDSSGGAEPYPLKEFVQVDFALPGCPVERPELLRVLGSLAHRDLPVVEDKSVCFECKLQENVCLLKEKQAMCLGPVTTGGCGALCVTHRLTCRGCRGPLVDANGGSMVDLLQAKGWPRDEVRRTLETFARGWLRLP